jgi:hypothetical protein
LEFSVVPVPANPQALISAGADDADVALISKWASHWIATKAKQAETDMALEVLDERTDTVLEIDGAFAEALRRRATSRRSEPYEPVCDISAAEIRRVLREVIAEQIDPAAIARVVRDTTTTALLRARGRVD